MRNRAPALLALYVVALTGCSVTNDRPPMLDSATYTARPTPTGQIAVEWPKPDDRLTPGAVTPGCTYPRPKTQRVVTAATKARVFAEYHYSGPTDLTHVEVDHRVPFSLCGSNGVANLWVEPYDGVQQTMYVHNYKDQLESVIAARVRSTGPGHMTLAEAQNVFLGDWRLSWCRYVHKPGVVC